MILSRRWFLGFTAGAALLLPSCADKAGSDSKKADGKTRVALITNVTADFWKICEAGAKKAGTEFGVDVIFKMPEELSVGKQKKLIDDVTKLGISGIAVSVINPKEQSADLKLIGEKVNLITMDNDAPDSGRLCFVGIDNYQGGQAAGKLVLDAMPEGGTIAIFIGAMDSDNARKRFQGTVDTLAGQKDAKGPKYGKYELYTGQAITDGGKREVCKPKASDALKNIGTDKPICMIGLYAYNPPAILEAAKSLGVADKIKIVGFDEDPDTLAGIAAGNIVGTVVQDPFQYGFKSVEILAALAKGDKSKLTTDAIPVKVLTKDGGPGRTKVADFEAELKKLLGK